MRVDRICYMAAERARMLPPEPSLLRGINSREERRDLAFVLPYTGKSGETTRISLESSDFNFTATPWTIRLGKKLHISIPTSPDKLPEFIEHCLYAKNPGSAKKAPHFENSVVRLLFPATPGQKRATDDFLEKAEGPQNIEECCDVLVKEGSQKDNPHFHGGINGRNIQVVGLLAAVGYKPAVKLLDVFFQKQPDTKGLSGTLTQIENRIPDQPTSHTDHEESEISEHSETVFEKSIENVAEIVIHSYVSGEITHEDKRNEVKQYISDTGAFSPDPRNKDKAEIDVGIHSDQSLEKTLGKNARLLKDFDTDTKAQIILTLTHVDFEKANRADFYDLVKKLPDSITTVTHPTEKTTYIVSDGESSHEISFSNIRRILALSWAIQLSENLEENPLYEKILNLARQLRAGSVTFSNFRNDSNPWVAENKFNVPVGHSAECFENAVNNKLNTLNEFKLLPGESGSAIHGSLSVVNGKLVEEDLCPNHLEQVSNRLLARNMLSRPPQSKIEPATPMFQQARVGYSLHDRVTLTPASLTKQKRADEGRKQEPEDHPTPPKNKKTEKKKKKENEPERSTPRKVEKVYRLHETPRGGKTRELFTGVATTQNGSEADETVWVTPEKPRTFIRESDDTSRDRSDIAKLPLAKNSNDASGDILVKPTLATPPLSRVALQDPPPTLAPIQTALDLILPQLEMPRKRYAKHAPRAKKEITHSAHRDVSTVHTSDAPILPHEEPRVVVREHDVQPRHHRDSPGTKAREIMQQKSIPRALRAFLPNKNIAPFPIARARRSTREAPPLQAREPITDIQQTPVDFKVLVFPRQDIQRPKHTPRIEKKLQKKRLDNFVVKPLITMDSKIATTPLRMYKRREKPTPIAIKKGNRELLPLQSIRPIQERKHTPPIKGDVVSSLYRANHINHPAAHASIRVERQSDIGVYHIKGIRGPTPPSPYRDEESILFRETSVAQGNPTASQDRPRVRVAKGIVRLESGDAPHIPQPNQPREETQEPFLSRSGSVDDRTKRPTPTPDAPATQPLLNLNDFISAVFPATVPAQRDIVITTNLTHAFEVVEKAESARSQIENSRTTELQTRSEAEQTEEKETTQNVESSQTAQATVVKEEKAQAGGTGEYTAGVKNKTRRRKEEKTEQTVIATPEGLAGIEDVKAFYQTERINEDVFEFKEENVEKTQEFRTQKVGTNEPLRLDIASAPPAQTNTRPGVQYTKGQSDTATPLQSYRRGNIQTQALEIPDEEFLSNSPYTQRDQVRELLYAV